jgi:BirA family biotin operon repressor/biotin-[acetyl-CoA-carboxylase] ligase
LTNAAATALCRGIEKAACVRPDVKWPNDVLVRGRKTAGVLTELSAELDKVKSVILGIGVDVNQTVADFPVELRRIATSLRIEAGRPLDRAELAAALLGELDREYALIHAGKFDAVADEWERRCTTLGCQLVIDVGGRQVRGRAESLDPDGALLVRTQHGHLERIMGGDVTVEK